MVTFLNIKKEDMKLLLENGLAIAEPKSKYEIMRMKGAIVAILFTSGKLLLQGADESVDKYKRLLLSKGFKQDKKPEFVKQEGTYIGSDEVLKGDTFGGIVVAGVKADDAQRESLRILGVMDSKLLTDDRIPWLADEVKRIAKTAIKNVYPEEYNQHNQTELLNLLHKEVAKELGTGLHVVDKYPGCTVGDIITTKAETKYIEVAAASIVARSEGLKQMRELSKRLGFDIPKGSTHVKDALEFLKKSKKDPKLFVKMHFGNVKAVFEN